MGDKITLVKNVGELSGLPIWIFNHGPINGNEYWKGTSMPLNPVERSDDGIYACYYYYWILETIVMKYIAFVELKVIGMF